MLSLTFRRPSVHSLLGSALPAKAPRPFAFGLFETLDAGYDPGPYADEAPEVGDAAYFDPDDDARWAAFDRAEQERERIALEVEAQARKPYQPSEEDWAAIRPISGGEPDEAERNASLERQMAESWAMDQMEAGRVPYDHGDAECRSFVGHDAMEGGAW